MTVHQTEDSTIVETFDQLIDYLGLTKTESLLALPEATREEFLAEYNEACEDTDRYEPADSVDEIHPAFAADFSFTHDTGFTESEAVHCLLDHVDADYVFHISWDSTTGASNYIILELAEGPATDDAH